MVFSCFFVVGWTQLRPGKNYSWTLYLTIIPRARVGYEMTDDYNHLISNKRERDNSFIKNNQETLLDLDDFAL